MTTQTFDEIMPSPSMKKRIMRGVYFHWFVKKYAPIFVVELSVLAALFIRELRVVSLVDIFQNAKESTASFTSIGTMISFFSSAFINTSSVSKILLFGISFVTVFIVRDMRRIIRHLNELLFRPRKAPVRIVS
ncbi:hypothetical protein KGQ34_01005 [Patescibacteria group bacterium]|nr:hypothetical protein [Patescibacteria group bacterium]